MYRCNSVAYVPQPGWGIAERPMRVPRAEGVAALLPASPAMAAERS